MCLEKPTLTCSCADVDLPTSHRNVYDVNPLLYTYKLIKIHHI